MNKRKTGYIFLEIVVVISIVSTMVLSMYQLIMASQRAKLKIQDKIELSQHMQEVDYQVRQIIREGTSIISIKKGNNEIKSLEIGQIYDISSIKINSKVNEEIQKTKNREIRFKKNTRSLLIGTLTNSNHSEAGGTEIGDYVESMKVGLNSENELLMILEFKKGDTTLVNKMILTLN